MLGESLLVFVLGLIYGQYLPSRVSTILISGSDLDGLGRHLDKRSRRVARQPASYPDTCILELFIHRYAKSVVYLSVTDACSRCAMQ